MPRCAFLFLWVALGFAQPPTELPSFEVAEIKLNQSGSPMSGSLRGSQFAIRGISLKLLIAAAWQIKDYAIRQAPAWIDSDRYDLIAKDPPGTSDETLHLMIRSLLIERFHLVAHTSQEVMNVFSLSVATGGSKLKETAGLDSSPGRCTGSRQQDRAVRICNNTSMAVFVQQLPQMSPHYVDRIVVDQTGLHGHFDFKFWWTPQQLQEQSPGPTILQSLESQLGLKLETRKLPVPTLVIDRAERLRP